MIDIHCHLIFAVDDGAYSIEESARMIEEAAEHGIKRIIATPHFHKEIFEDEKMMGNFCQLEGLAEDFGVKLEMGYEVFFTPFIANILKEKKNLTLANSRYLLVELPFNRIPLYSFDVIYKLNLMGIVPVLAHPERNKNFIRNISFLEKFVETGCLIQMDAASIVGIYGVRVKEFSKRLLIKGLVSFIASDAHSFGDYAKWYRPSYEKVRKLLGEEYTQVLYNKNPQIILNDMVNKRISVI